MENNILIIKVNTFLRTNDLNDLRRSILAQVETGVVFIPHYCEAVYVPCDVEIKYDRPGEELSLQK